MKNTKYFLILIILFSSFSCRTWSPLMYESTKAPISNLLPSMQLYTGTEYNYEIISQTEFRLFREEMENNIMDPYGDKYGSVFYSSRVVEKKENFVFFTFSGLTLYTINLLGFPLHRIKQTTEVEIRITDLKGRLVKSYKSYGHSKSSIALFYGYNFVDAYQKVEYECATEALKSFRMQISQDSEEISNLLRATENELYGEEK